MCIALKSTTIKHLKAGGGLFEKVLETVFTEQTIPNVIVEKLKNKQ